jgi:chromosome partitioning protein
LKTITFSAVKGGVGKSSLAILTANYLAAAGERVLVLDFDIQNSTTFFYLEDPETADSHNLARALQEDDLTGNIVPGLFLDVVPSSFNLLKLRSTSDKTLKRILPQVADRYDYAVVDTPPTFDNLVLNAIVAADVIVTPVYLSLFDWKSAAFLREQIEVEAEKLDSWRVLFNRYTEPRTDNPDAEINQYKELFRSDFGPYLLETRIPETRQVQKAIDTRASISTAKAKVRLHDAIASLAAEITGDSPDVERF